MDAEGLVRDYLGRLDTAAARLPPSRRAELTVEVHGHIEAALAEAGSRDDITVRNILERLGTPDEIVAAEAGTEAGWTGVPDGAAASGGSRGRLGAIEVVAILLLTVGAFLLPFVGPLLGLVFVWLSDRWTRGQKLIATLIVVVLMALPLALIFGAAAAAGGGQPSLSNPVEIPAMLVGP